MDEGNININYYQIGDNYVVTAEVAINVGDTVLCTDHKTGDIIGISMAHRVYDRGSIWAEDSKYDVLNYMYRAELILYSSMFDMERLPASAKSTIMSLTANGSVSYAAPVPYWIDDTKDIASRIKFILSSNFDDNNKLIAIGIVIDNDHPSITIGKNGVSIYHDAITEPVRYMKFTDTNDWEGEAWNFYVPLTDPNCKLLMDECIRHYNEYAESSLNVDGSHTFTESEVRVLVKNSHDGYLPTHNVATISKVPVDDDPEMFYSMVCKGSIFTRIKCL